MAARDLSNAFDDCLDRLNNGETLQACLDAYPQFANDLRPMLQAGLAVRLARPHPLEVQTAQDRGRARVLQALQQPQPTLVRVDRWQPLQHLLVSAALLVLIFGAFLGGATLAAESSLPGDPLYGLKRATENVRLLADNQLATQFAQRRRDEIRQLQALQRAETVDFTGRVTALNGANWEVAGLALTVPDNTPDAADVQLNAEVAVSAFTTTAGELIAQRITLIEQGEQPPVTPSLIPTAAPSLTPTLSPSTTALPTQTVTVTAAPTLTSTPPAPTSLPTTAGCVAVAPEGWVTYTIRAGDTLSLLAAQTGITLEQLMSINCLEDARFIVIGQQLFLPFAPTFNDPDDGPTNDNDSGSSSSGNTNSNTNSSTNNDNDDSSSGSGNSNSNDNDDDDDSGGNSGSGGGDDDDD